MVADDNFQRVRPLSTNVFKDRAQVRLKSADVVIHHSRMRHRGLAETAPLSRAPLSCGDGWMRGTGCTYVLDRRGSRAGISVLDASNL